MYYVTMTMMLTKCHMQELLDKQEQYGPRELHDLMLPECGEDYNNLLNKFVAEKRSGRNKDTQYFAYTHWFN